MTKSRSDYRLVAIRRPGGVYGVRSTEVYDGEILVRATSEQEAIDIVSRRITTAIDAGLPPWQFDDSNLV